MTPVWFAATVSDWDKIFDELYLRTYANILDNDVAPAQAELVVRLVGLEPGADLLDCPCGYGRHSIEFARLGLHVVGADRSEVLLAEAKRRADEGAWPRWVQADYRELPFEDASFDCVTNLFSSLGYWGEEGDLQALREFRRVLRPGGKLVVETMHRDRLMAIYVPRHWHDLPDGSLVVEERTIDYVKGTTAFATSSSTRRVATPRTTRCASTRPRSSSPSRARQASSRSPVTATSTRPSRLSRDTRLVVVAS